MDNEKIARENLLRKGEEITGISVKGYDFNLGANYKKIIESFASTGFQASNLSSAI